jgi:hypothetical protein
MHHRLAKVHAITEHGISPQQRSGADLAGVTAELHGPMRGGPTSSVAQPGRGKPQMRLVLIVLVEFARIQWSVWRGFATLQRSVVSQRVVSETCSQEQIDSLIAAVTEACMFYPFRTRCLQRSAALTRLLRRAGVPAQMVIGYCPVPLRSHAWVELAGRVISGKIHHQERFIPIDRW